MKFPVIALALLANSVNANKSAKAGTASFFHEGSKKAKSSAASCSNFSSSSKQSKAYSSGCEDGVTTEVGCGAFIDNEHVFLLKDLICGRDETIVLDGPEAVLNCDHRTIIGQSGFGGPLDSDDVLVELRNGASVINCNFRYGWHAIETFGNGCVTIENVEVHSTYYEGIVTHHDGTVVIRDTSVQESYDDGIELNVADGNSLHAILENVRSERNGYCDVWCDGAGIALGCDNEGDVCSGDISAELFGRVFMHMNYGSNLLASSSDIDIDITVYGELHSSESYYEGVYVSNGNSITFASGSNSELCENSFVGGDYEDLDTSDGGSISVETGANIICDYEDTDTDNRCTASCDVDTAGACVA